jgi:hypothetical protein
MWNNTTRVATVAVLQSLQSPRRRSVLGHFLPVSELHVEMWNTRIATVAVLQSLQSSRRRSVLSTSSQSQNFMRRCGTTQPELLPLLCNRTFNLPDVALYWATSFQSQNFMWRCGTAHQSCYRCCVIEPSVYQASFCTEPLPSNLRTSCGDVEQHTRVATVAV